MDVLDALEGGTLESNSRDPEFECFAICADTIDRQSSLQNASTYPLYIRPQSLQTTANEYQGLPASAPEAAAVKSFGDLPLIVLTARLNDNPGWPEWQAELLQLSSNSQQLFAENSGHVIQFDEPKAAVDAIVKMVELVR